MSESKASSGIRESLSPLKQAFLALEEAEQRIRQLEQQASEPIAIVGLGCRFPGGNDGPEGFWQLLRNRECSVRDGVEARLRLSLEREHLPQQARWAALLGRVDLFDPRHFGIAPREAGAMDPQQRLLLEVSWEALEDAGIDPFALYQSRTGVYVGIASHDYAQLAMRHQRLDQIDQYFASGGGASVAAGRISYVLGLNGPALSVDTACSSSLVAVHLACEALQRGECTTALAAGVNLILSPESCAAFAQAGMLSPRGVCAAFDEGADGFVRGEGCGVVVLKRLRDAEAAGDRVQAVILGSAVNQDGASSGLTVPNGLAQQALLREAHRRAGIGPRQVGYVEAHGTGTRLGDPIEAEALGSVFNGREQKLAIGSVKSNIGHLEAAAGVAGLIKLVLSLEHGEIPGQVHWQRPSEHVRWAELPLEVATESRSWELIEGRRIGGVSSFGFSGTNAHVVVEGRRCEARESEATGEDVLVISARTEAALRELVGRYAQYLETEEEWNWEEICHTAGAGRAEMSERLAVVACSGGEAAEKLRGWLHGEAVAGISAGHVGAGQRGMGEVDAQAMPARIAEAWVQGAKVDWGRRRGERHLRRARLPGYAFQRERYWIEERQETRETGEATGRGMLGRRLQVAGVSAQYEARLAVDSWVGEHVVEGRVILPATGHIELMLEAAAETLGSPCDVEDVVLQTALEVEKERRVQVAVEEETGGRCRVRVYAECAEGEWERVSEGWLRKSESARPERLDLTALESRLEEREAGEVLYSLLRSRGLDFGERFRGVRRLWNGNGEALGEIATTTDTKGKWELWPWALDACLQVVGGTGEPGALYLPMSMEKIEVFSAIPETVRSWVQAARLNADTFSASILVTALDGSAVLRISELRFRRKPEERQKVPLYRIEWERADVSEDLLPKVADELNTSIPQRAAEKNASDYVSLFNQMEDLSAAYVSEAFLKLGWPGPEARLSNEDLERRWHILPKRRPLLRRMLEIAVETGAAVQENDVWRFPATPQTNAEAQSRALARQYPHQSAELSLLQRCGVALADVLAGKLDGRELIFPGGSSEEMEQIYRGSLPAKIYNHMLAEAVVRIATAKTGSVRILEVGGGTGATTEIVLKALREAQITPEEYLFTDISPLLTRRTHERVMVDPFSHAQTFNLEQDAAAQGIATRFDIILAVNVLHATSDIRATLCRLKTLLAGDGQLLITEVIGKQRWSDLTVGLLDEWWHFTDHDLRPDHPALPKGLWKKVLLDAGFAGVQIVPAVGQGLFAYQELILARGVPADRAAVVVGDDVLAQQVALRLDARLVRLPESLSFEGSVPETIVWVAPQTSVLTVSLSASVEASVRSLLSAFTGLADLASSPRLYVITRGAVPPGDHQVRPLDALLAGLATGITSERPELRCTRIDVSGEDTEEDAIWIASEVGADGDEPWIARRKEGRFRARLAPLELLAPISVELSAGNGIETLAYRPAKRKELAPDEVRIAVYATALNFRDVLQASGVVHLGAPMGTDCAGIIVEVGSQVTEFCPGNEVAAIAAGCFASEAIAASALTVLLPAGLSFAQASAQAVACLTAEYALCEVGGLKSGDRILIHAAAGGTGLAAVHLSQQLGAEVIATAGSERKRAWLRSLGIREVYDSRSADFAKQIKGGVDIVLNSLAGESVDAGAGLLRPGGRFLELGKTDLRSPEEVQRRWPEIRYLPVDLTPLLAARSPWVKERLAAVLTKTAEGSFPRLPVSTFDDSETRSAFRFMSRAEQIGRIVVTRKHQERIRGTHLIVGGMRGVGLRLAAWLVEHGARAVVLVGRNAPGEEARRVIEHLRTNGTAVRICEGDIADEAVAQRAVDLAGQDLRGVWHSAGILENAPLEQQTWDRIRNVLRPKVDGAWNLHRLTLGSELDQFVLFSSWASIAGSHGQANHCAANAFLDGLAHWRRSQGLPAMSINWGAWAEMGAAAEDDVERQLARSGMRKMSPDAALDGLLAALSSNEPQVAVGAIDWPRYLAQRPGRLQQALYSRWLHKDISQASGPGNRARVVAHDGDSPVVGRDPAALAWMQLPPAAREPALIRIVADHVRRVLDLHSDEEIDPEMPLSDLGMDSLLAVELRNCLSGAFGRPFPSTLLFDYPNLRSLARHIEAQSSSSLSTGQAVVPKDSQDPRGDGDLQGEGATVLDLLDAIEQLSDDDVEAFLEHDQRPVYGVNNG